MNVKGRKAKMAAGLTAGAMLLGLTGPMAIAETVKGDVNSGAKANTAWKGEGYGMKAQPKANVEAKGSAEAKNDGMSEGYGMKVQPKADVEAKGDVETGDVAGVRADGKAGTDTQTGVDGLDAADLPEKDMLSKDLTGSDLIPDKDILANQVGKDVLGKDLAPVKDVMDTDLISDKDLPVTGLIPNEEVLNQPTISYILNLVKELDNSSANYVLNLVKQITGIVDHTPNNGSTPNPL